MNRLRDSHPTLFFVLPVMLECLLSTGAGLIFSYLIGGISGSALTTISLGNQVINLIVAMATMLVTGSGILCARLLGGGEQMEASKIVEQTLFLSAVAGIAVTTLCLIFAGPLMTLLMPNAEPVVLAEGIAFFRVLILSLPFVFLTNSVSSTLRASGDSRSPMVITFTVCGLQLFFAWILLRVLGMDVMGAGLVYLLCRIGGTSIALYILLHSHRYHLNARRMLQPDKAAFKRILSVGIPTSVESIFVQTGYLVANSMVIGLGTFEAAAYNVANTLYSFASLVQSISSSVAMTLVGQLIGAKAYKQARKTGWTIWGVGMSASLFLSAMLLVFGNQLAPIYTSDPGVQAAAVASLWAVFVMCIPAISLNTLDPQLRVGGDVKYVMYVTIIAVWAIRLPATWLFCYHWHWGAAGVFWANTVSLFFRMILNGARYIKGKYLYMRV
ncbi:MAG: MATE family efflux transporter [Clostridia bacterium]|nr:MATE family efflux transporter [Clostridia bacterium]